MDMKQDAPFFHNTALGDVITKQSLALGTVKNGMVYPSGTAMIIGKNLAVTAKHVLEGFAKDTHKVELKPGENKDLYEVVAFNILNKDSSNAI